MEEGGIRENELRYPDEDELFAFFDGPDMGLENARSNFKKNGILYLTNQKSEVARYASRLFYGYEDFQMMRSILDSKETNEKISGFQIKTSETLTDLRNSFVPGIVNQKNKLSIEGVEVRGKDAFVVKYYYEHRTYGKMNLMDTQHRTGEFRIEKGPEDKFKIVLFNHNKNEDYKAVEHVINDMIEKKDGKAELIELGLTNFDVKTRIEFIDKVLSYDYPDWRLLSVKALRVKKPNTDPEEADDTPDDDDEEEEESREVEEVNAETNKELLEGINDALLRGNNLRTNKFVKECERAGFYFPKVVMRMEHKSEPYRIDLSVEFKFRPIMPEVEILKSYLVDEGFDQPYTFSRDYKREVLDAFFRDVMVIFNKLSKKQKRS